jgi:PAS domain-containing protein
MDEHLRRAPVGVLRTTTDGVVTASNDAATDLLETSRDALNGAAIRDAFPAAATGMVGQVFRSDSPEAESVKEYYPPIDRWLAVEVVPADGAVTLLRTARSATRTDSALSA